MGQPKRGTCSITPDLTLRFEPQTAEYAVKSTFGGLGDRPLLSSSQLLQLNVIGTVTAEHL